MTKNWSNGGIVTHTGVMTDRVLILGGRGRIGSSVAQDIATHTQAQITITGRSPASEKDITLPSGKNAVFGARLGRS